MYGPFLESAGTSPVVATLVLDEGDGLEQFARWAEVLRRTAPCEPVPVLVPLGGQFSVGALPQADALLVCGGLTPAYAAALVPSAAAIREWLLAGDRPYAGFSAGAAVGADRALVGGWRHRGVQVCPDDAAEGLEEVRAVEGLGLLSWSVDVHCAQWGTLPRLLAAVGDVPHGRGLAIDENTAVHIDGLVGRVAGLGAIQEVTRSRSGTVQLRSARTSSTIAL